MNGFVQFWSGVLGINRRHEALDKAYSELVAELFVTDRRLNKQPTPKLQELERRVNAAAKGVSK